MSEETNRNPPIQPKNITVGFPNSQIPKIIVCRSFPKRIKNVDKGHCISPNFSKIQPTETSSCQVPVFNQIPLTSSKIAGVENFSVCNFEISNKSNENKNVSSFNKNSSYKENNEFLNLKTDNHNTSPKIASEGVNVQNLMEYFVSNQNEKIAPNVNQNESQFESVTGYNVKIVTKKKSKKQTNPYQFDKKQNDYFSYQNKFGDNYLFESTGLNEHIRKNPKKINTFSKNNPLSEIKKEDEGNCEVRKNSFKQQIANPNYQKFHIEDQNCSLKNAESRDDYGDFQRKKKDSKNEKEFHLSRINSKNKNLVNQIDIANKTDKPEKLGLKKVHSENDFEMRRLPKSDSIKNDSNLEKKNRIISKLIDNDKRPGGNSTDSAKRDTESENRKLVAKVFKIQSLKNNTFREKSPEPTDLSFPLHMKQNRLRSQWAQALLDEDKQRIHENFDFKEKLKFLKKQTNKRKEKVEVKKESLKLKKMKQNDLVFLNEVLEEKYSTFEKWTSQMMSFSALERYLRETGREKLSGFPKVNKLKFEKVFVKLNHFFNEVYDSTEKPFFVTETEVSSKVLAKVKKLLHKATSPFDFFTRFAGVPENDLKFIGEKLQQVLMVLLSKDNSEKTTHNNSFLFHFKAAEHLQLLSSLAMKALYDELLVMDSNFGKAILNSAFLNSFVLEISLSVFEELLDDFSSLAKDKRQSLVYLKKMETLNSQLENSEVENELLREKLEFFQNENKNLKKQIETTKSAKKVEENELLNLKAWMKFAEHRDFTNMIFVRESLEGLGMDSQLKWFGELQNEYRKIEEALMKQSPLLHQHVISLDKKLVSSESPIAEALNSGVASRGLVECLDDYKTQQQLKIALQRKEETLNSLKGDVEADEWRTSIRKNNSFDKKSNMIGSTFENAREGKNDAVGSNGHPSQQKNLKRVSIMTYGQSTAINCEIGKKIQSKEEGKKLDFSKSENSNADQIFHADDKNSKKQKNLNEVLQSKEKLIGKTSNGGSIKMKENYNLKETHNLFDSKNSNGRINKNAINKYSLEKQKRNNSKNVKDFSKKVSKDNFLKNSEICLSKNNFNETGSKNNEFFDCLNQNEKFLKKTDSRNPLEKNEALIHNSKDFYSRDSNDIKFPDHSKNNSKESLREIKNQKKEKITEQNNESLYGNRISKEEIFRKNDNVMPKIKETVGPSIQRKNSKRNESKNKKEREMFPVIDKIKQSREENFKTFDEVKEKAAEKYSDECLGVEKTNSDCRNDESFASRKERECLYIKNRPNSENESDEITHRNNKENKFHIISKKSDELSEEFSESMDEDLQDNDVVLDIKESQNFSNEKVQISEETKNIGKSCWERENTKLKKEEIEIPNKKELLNAIKDQTKSISDKSSTENELLKLKHLPSPTQHDKSANEKNKKAKEKGSEQNTEKIQLIRKSTESDESITNVKKTTENRLISMPINYSINEQFDKQIEEPGGILKPFPPPGGKTRMNREFIIVNFGRLNSLSKKMDTDSTELRQIVREELKGVYQFFLNETKVVTFEDYWINSIFLLADVRFLIIFEKYDIAFIKPNHLNYLIELKKQTSARKMSLDVNLQGLAGRIESDSNPHSNRTSRGNNQMKELSDSKLNRDFSEEEESEGLSTSLVVRNKRHHSTYHFPSDMPPFEKYTDSKISKPNPSKRKLNPSDLTSPKANPVAERYWKFLAQIRAKLDPISEEKHLKEQFIAEHAKMSQKGFIKVYYALIDVALAYKKRKPKDIPLFILESILQTVSNGYRSQSVFWQFLACAFVFSGKLVQARLVLGFFGFQALYLGDAFWDLVSLIEETQSSETKRTTEGIIVDSKLLIDSVNKVFNDRRELAKRIVSDIELVCSSESGKGCLVVEKVMIKHLSEIGMSKLGICNDFYHLNNLAQNGEMDFGEFSNVLMVFEPEFYGSNLKNLKGFFDKFCNEEGTLDPSAFTSFAKEFELLDFKTKIRINFEMRHKGLVSTAEELISKWSKLRSIFRMFFEQPVDQKIHMRIDNLNRILMNYESSFDEWIVFAYKMIEFQMSDRLFQHQLKKSFLCEEFDF